MVCAFSFLTNHHFCLVDHKAENISFKYLVLCLILSVFQVVLKFFGHPTFQPVTPQHSTKK